MTWNSMKFHVFSHKSLWKLDHPLPSSEMTDCEKNALKNTNTTSTWEKASEFTSSNGHWTHFASFCFAFAMKQKHDPKYSEKRSLQAKQCMVTKRVIFFHFPFTIIFLWCAHLHYWSHSLQVECDEMKWNEIERSGNLKIASKRCSFSVRSTAMSLLMRMFWLLTRASRNKEETIICIRMEIKSSTAPHKKCRNFVFG